MLGDYTSVRVIATHVSFYDNQQNTIRMWPATEPNGRSITITPYSGLESIRLNGDGYVWNFYQAGQNQYITADAHINQWIDTNKVYFMNVQNLENRDNHFYLKFIYI